jgi:hypothetical protein
MNKRVSRISTALALSGALFCAQAGATSQPLQSSAYDEVTAPQTMTVVEPDGSVTAYTFADPELLAVAEPDGMVTYYELTPLALMPDSTYESDSSSNAAAEGATFFVPDGTGWAYVPSRFVTPEEAAAYLAVTDENPAAIYIATYVSSPEFSQLSTE